MEHSNNNSSHRLINGFQGSASTAGTFPNPFQGMQPSNANFGLLHAQLQSLSNPMLPAGADIAQWAAVSSQQQHNQQWMGGVDPAKVAQILPMYQQMMFTGTSKAMDFTQPDMNSQQNVNVAQAHSSTGQFGNTPTSAMSSSTPSMVQSPRLSHLQDVRNSSHGSPQCPLSNGPPSSHHSTSTPNELDVGISQPASQSQAFDLSMNPRSKESEHAPSPLVQNQLHQQHNTQHNLLHHPPPINNVNQGYNMMEPSTSSQNQNLDDEQWIENIDIMRLSDMADNLDYNVALQPDNRRNSGGGGANNYYNSQQNDEDGCEFDKVFKMVADKVDGTGADGLFGDKIEESGGLSPIQFTPPDSPEPGPSLNIASLFASPKSSASSLDLGSVTLPSTSSVFPTSVHLSSSALSSSQTPFLSSSYGLGLAPTTSSLQAPQAHQLSASSSLPSTSKSSLSSLGNISSLTPINNSKYTTSKTSTQTTSLQIPSTSNSMPTLQNHNQTAATANTKSAQNHTGVSTLTQPKSKDPFKPPPPSNKIPIWKKITETDKKESKPFSKPIQKSAKIPIYKQKFPGGTAMDDELDKKNSKKDDAFDFDEEDEPVSLVQQDSSKLDAELKERISKLSAQSDGRSRNVYVPGVGFAVPPEHSASQDLWRHVVPKKRPIGEHRPIIPSTNLLPSSVHAEANQAAARLAEPEIVDLAESIRRRKKDRLSCSFIKTEATTSQECVKEEGADRRVDDNRSEDRPRLPKLIIRLPRRITNDEPEKISKHLKRSRKKKESSEEDSDWEGSDTARRKRARKGGKRGRRAYSGYEVRLVERDELQGKYNSLNRDEAEEKPDVSMMSKKQRLMRQWEEDGGAAGGGNTENGRDGSSERGSPEIGMTAVVKHEDTPPVSFVNGQMPVRANGHTLEEPKRPIRRMVDFNTEAVKLRLSKFSSAEGKLAKGTFVVNKSDLFRDDCALWKVDNQNLLQKFPPRTDPITKVITYRNSSTYSGWCDQIAGSYYTVKVKMIKHSRSESIVEPEVPLNDLFAAVTSDMANLNGFVKGDEGTCENSFEDSAIARDQLKSALLSYIQVMISHALTLEHIQSLKEKNDWNFLNAVTEIERINGECEQKLKSRLKGAGAEYERRIHSYTSMNVCDSEQRDILCQTCALATVDKIVQLFSRDSYDSDSLQTIFKEEEEDEQETPLPAMEMYVCSTCAVVVQYQHKCHHLKYHLLKKCEDKLECFGTQYPDYSPEKIIELAKKNRQWIERLIDEYADMWKRINESDF